MYKEMIMPRNHQLRSLCGWTGQFTANEPLKVHPHAVGEALAAGARFVDEKEFTLVEEPKDLAPKFVSTPEREQRILEAFEEIKDRNRRGDFLATGFPNLRAVADLSGLEALTHQEVQPLWTRFTQEAE